MLFLIQILFYVSGFGKSCVTGPSSSVYSMFYICYLSLSHDDHSKPAVNIHI